MPPLPQLTDVDERQQALRRYHILDTAPERNFDQVTRTVANVTGAAIAQITLIDKERLWFKSCFGFDGAREAPLESTFCLHTVAQEEMMVVEDMTKDERFKDNPFVTGETHVRFYAGAPLTTPDGIHLGALCILDTEPKIFDAAQRTILEDMADLVVNQFELRSAEAQYRNLFERNGRPMMIYDPNTLRILAANDAAVWQYGYAANALTTMTVRDLHPPEHVPESIRGQNVPRDGGIYTGSEGTAHHRKKNGSTLLVEVDDRPIFYEGKSRRLLSASEITERLRTEQRLRDEQERSRSLLDRLPGAVFETDVSGRIQHVGGDWEALTGRTARAVEGTSFLDLVHPDDRTALSADADALRNGATERLCREVRILTENGTPQRGELRARLREGQDGSTIVGTLVDLAARAPAAPYASTENGEALEAPQREDREAQARESAFDEIFDGLNFDDASDDAFGDFAEAPGASSNGQSETAFQEWQDLAQASEELLDDGALTDTEATSFDLADELREQADDRRRRAREKGIVLHLDLPGGETVTLPRQALRRMFSHVVETALEKTAYGSITVSTEHEGRDLVVRVADTSDGMSEDAIGRVLNGNPDELGESGRRLHAARKMARQADGDLTLESIEGHGTIYRLRFPAKPETALDA